MSILFLKQICCNEAVPAAHPPRLEHPKHRANSTWAAYGCGCLEFLELAQIHRNFYEIYLKNL